MFLSWMPAVCYAVWVFDLPSHAEQYHKLYNIAVKRCQFGLLQFLVLTDIYSNLLLSVLSLNPICGLPSVKSMRTWWTAAWHAIVREYLLLCTIFLKAASGNVGSFFFRVLSHNFPNVVIIRARTLAFKVFL